MPLARLAGLVLLAAALLAAACGDDGPRAREPTAGATIETITTADGVVLDARLFAAVDGRLVVLLHRFSEDQRSWFDFARDLQELGLSVLTLDFRGHGSSAGEKDPGVIDCDVRAALAFARERGFNRIVLVGASMGGTAAIVVAAEEPVEGVAGLSAAARIRGLDARPAASALAAPLTLAAAKGDVSAIDSLGILAERAELPDGAVLTVEGSAHGADLLTGREGDRVRAWLLTFLEEVWSS